jgi:hypothetical protein
VDDKSKTIAGLIVACVIGLGEALSHGAGMGLVRLGRGIEAVEAGIPKLNEPIPLLSAAGRAASNASGNANVSQSTVSSPTPTITNNSADSPEEAIKGIPGAVVIAHRWIVAKIRIPIGTESQLVCMAFTKEDNHALFFYTGRSFPFILGVGVFGPAAIQMEPGDNVSVSFDRRPPERFSSEEQASVEAMKVRLFFSGARASSVLTSIRTARYLTISLNGASWKMDMSGSNQAIVALADCAKRTV